MLRADTWRVTWSLLVRRILGAFALLVAPAREMAFDDLAISAGSGQLTAGEVDLAFTLVVGELRAQFFVEGGGELPAAARDVPLGEREVGSRSDGRRRRDRRRQSSSRCCGSRAPTCEVSGCNTCVIDCRDKMATADHLSSLADLAKRAEPVAIFGHS